MPTPYIRKLRNRESSRVRHSNNLKTWLSAQAARLSTSVAVIFNLMRSGYTANQVQLLSGDPDIANTVAPTISGTVAVGNTLTKSSNGTWTGLMPIVYTFQWRRAGVDIPGATSATYVIPADGTPGSYTCVVTATNAAGKMTATSNSLS